MGFLNQLGLNQLGQLADTLNKLDKLSDSLLADDEQGGKRATGRQKRKRMLTLDACIAKAYADKEKYSQITGFIVAVKRLGMSDADGLEITVAYTDKNRKAITLDGETALAYTCKVTTVDEKLVDLLDGNNSAMYEL